MYDRKVIKQEARQAMRSAAPHFMLVALIYYLLTTALNSAASMLTGGVGMGTGALSMFLTILVSLFSIVMGVGFCNYALRLTRNEEAGINSLFYGFSFAGRAIGAQLLVFLYAFLWAMLCTVVVAIAVAVVAMIAGDSPVLIGVLAAVLYIGVVTVCVAIMLRYAMVNFALIENPDDGVTAAIRRSVLVMRGHKGKLFVLHLSFLGWELLVGLIGAVILGIGIAVSGTGEMLMSAVQVGVKEDIWAAYSVVEELIGKLTLWAVLADLISLPLNLWVITYLQTSVARFYNYVGGYDYCQYMNRGQSAPTADEPVPVTSAPEYTQPRETPAAQEPPAGGYYTPAPVLDEEPVIAEETPELPAEEPETPAAEPETPAEEPEVKPETPEEPPAEPEEI